jgi:ketosteroid isomerase-like protein
MKDLITEFYSSFSRLEADKMIACYHKNVVFEDPAFGVLEGDRAKAMWQMLCESQKGKDFKVTFSNIEASEKEGSANWEAFYTFSKTGRKVHNKINAQFEFKDGLIIKHTDYFNLHKWAKQAMGFKGLILGRTRYFKSKLRAQTNSLLDNYIKKQKATE